jgi:hypothetical protein
MSHFAIFSIQVMLVEYSTTRATADEVIIEIIDLPLGAASNGLFYGCSKPP